MPSFKQLASQIRRFQADQPSQSQDNNPLAVPIKHGTAPVSEVPGMHAPIIYTIPFIDPAVSGENDAFGRARISVPRTLFDSKQLHDKQPVFWTEDVPSGTTSVHSSDRASTLLHIDASTNDFVIRRSRQRFNYQSGKSQEILMTGVFGASAAGVTKRIGYFDVDNGLFFQLDEDGTFNVVNRSNITGSPVNTEIAQADWNLDRLDGTGPSGVTLDLAKAQIFVIDFEWLSTGPVRYGFMFNNEIVYCHRISHANVETGAYMSTPNLPLCYEMQGSAANAAADLEHICATVISEGGSISLGQHRVADRAITGITQDTNGGADLIPLISIRLNSDEIDATIMPEMVAVHCLDTAVYRWALILNPDIAGSDAVSWVDVLNSAIEYDVTRDNTNIVSNGEVIASGYVENTNQGSSPLSFASLLTPFLGEHYDSGVLVADELVLCAQRADGTATAVNFLGGITWRELL